MFTCMWPHEGECVWRPEAGTRSLPQLLSILFTEAGFPISQSGLCSQPATGIPYLHLLKGRVVDRLPGPPACMWPGRQNSGSRARPASAVSDSSLQPLNIRSLIISSGKARRRKAEQRCPLGCVVQKWGLSLEKRLYTCNMNLYYKFMFSHLLIPKSLWVEKTGVRI